MRNVKKETEWRKKNYKRLEIKVRKEKAEKFIKKLQEENKSVNGWGNEQIKKYLKKS